MRSAEECVCGHTRHWHGQQRGATPGTGACDECDCQKFVTPDPQHVEVPVPDEAYEAAYGKYWRSCDLSAVDDAAPHIAAKAVEERDRELEQIRKALEEAEDRYVLCDNCERPSREGDLETIWCREPESGEQVDARICAACRAEERAREAVEQERERLARLIDEQAEATWRKAQEVKGREPVRARDLEQIAAAQRNDVALIREALLDTKGDQG